jgi:hypothetical protein
MLAELVAGPERRRIAYVVVVAVAVATPRRGGRDLFTSTNGSENLRTGQLGAWG